MFTFNWSNLRSLLIPSLCLLCHAPADQFGTICHACCNDLPSLPESCAQCGKFFSPTISEPIHATCGACLRKAPPFNYTLAAFPYTSPIIELISAFKFKGDLSNANLLSNLFIQRARFTIPPDLLIPIPLHPKRLATRGFNQSIILGRYFARYYNCPLATNLIARKRHTRPQLGLNAADRERNMRNAFLIQHGSELRNKNLVVIDDVMTTGATITAICKHLQQFHPKTIGIWVLARNG